MSAGIGMRNLRRTTGDASASRRVKKRRRSGFMGEWMRECV
jgi:hypothetical protein